MMKQRLGVRGGSVVTGSRLLLLSVAISIGLPTSFGATPDAGTQSLTLSERSQQQAAAVLKRAIAAMGGVESLSAIEAVKYTLRGPVQPRLQTPSAAPPYDSAEQGETVVLDLKDQRLLFEQCFAGFGLQGHNTLTLQDGQALLHNHLAHAVWPLPSAQASPQQLAQQARRVPALLLRQVMSNSAALRYLGEATFAGRPHDVVSVTTDEIQNALYIDQRTGLLSKSERMVPDPIEGLASVEIEFNDYVRAGAYMVPQGMTLRQAGQEMAHYTIQVEINPAPARRVFEVESAKDYVREPAATFEPRVEKLGEGVYLLQSIAGPNYHTLAVEFSDHVLAVDAPLSVRSSDAVIARIKQLIPTKPIRYIVVTHHHADHIGGLRSFVAEGATVVTTPENEALIAAMMSGKHDDRLAAQPKPVKTLLIDGRRVFSDKTQTVEVINVGPQAHAREMLVAHLPKQRVLYQADLFIVPNTVLPFEATPQAAALLAQRLRELSITVDTLANAHGRTARWYELQQFASRNVRTAGVCGQAR